MAVPRLDTNRMRNDPRQLRPAEAVRLLNSTPLGEVISELALRRHRARAGYRIGSGRAVDLVRYAAWLCLEHDMARRRRNDAQRPADAPASRSLGGDYGALKQRARARNARLSLEGRDIAPLPEVADPARRAAAEASLEVFLTSYFPETFALRFSDDHRTVIAAIERAAREGWLQALSMPRGSGKTSICERAALWSVLTGLHRFVAIIGADETAAVELLDAIKTELETNDLLLADWPEAVYPIRRLEGITNRSRGQLFDGQRTRIGWLRKTIVLPTIPGSKASGAIIKCAGLSARLRGMKHQRADGQAARPSLVLLDDPQTDRTAMSDLQCDRREAILAGAVLYMAGPGKRIAGVMPCTVIRADDMADRILDPAKHPEWHGLRMKAMYAFPANEKLWEEYRALLLEGLRSGAGIARATAFYAEHRAEMDLGAKVAWPERFNEDEVSAVQHLMNLKFRDERAFAAEMQNEPLAEQYGDGEQLTADTISERLNRHRRGLVPSPCTRATAFIDVHQKLLYWLVAAWCDDFTGHVVDYGAWPEQGRGDFSLADAKVTLQRKAPGAGLEGAIRAGLETLCQRLLGAEWPRDDGAALRVERCLIDANWGQSTEVVYQFCRQSRHAAVLLPSHGRAIGPDQKPMSEWQKRPGDRLGLGWCIASGGAKRAVRHAVFDTNYWKSFVRARLQQAVGDRGALMLFGSSAREHRALAEHLAAEYSTRTTGRGRVVDVWKQRPDRPDNHWLDCLVGAAVAASIQGCGLPGADAPAAPRRKIRLSDLQRARRAGEIA